MEYKEALQKLKELDLSKYPTEEVNHLIMEIGSYGVVNYKLYEGNFIARGRVNTKGEEFTNVNQLSFKPQEFNKTYMRASTPFRTMFYGSFLPESRRGDEPPDPRIPITFEILEEVRDTDSIFEREITFSRWDVVNEINCLSIIHHTGFQNPPQTLLNLRNEYDKFLAKYPKEAIKSKEIVEYFAEEFSKTEIKKDSDYLVSAIFSELNTNTFDGIIYPSVRLGGEGINIAITSECVNSSLKIRGVVKSTVYKYKKGVVIGNDKVGEIDETGTINYKMAPKEIFMSKEEGRNRAYMTHIRQQ